MLDQLIKALAEADSENTLSALFEQAQRQQIKQFADEAAQVLKMHHFQNLPNPNGGDTVRCVYNYLKDTLPIRGFEFNPVANNVYHVIASSTDPDTHPAIMKYLEENDFPLPMRNLIRLAPEETPCYLLIRDPETGVVNFMSYPAAAGQIFNMADDDAENGEFNFGLTEGTELKLVRKAAAGIDFTVGNHYVIEKVVTVCECGDDDCLARGMVAYELTDDVGSTVPVMLPFSPVGDFEVVQ